MLKGGRRGQYLLFVLAAVAISLLGSCCDTVSGFSNTRQSDRHIVALPSSLRILHATTKDDNQDMLLYSDEVEEEDEEEEERSISMPWKKNARWKSLSPKVKQAVIRQAQQRAIANKKKREPAQVRKRRMMMFFRKKQQEKKRASRIKRPTTFTDRTPLVELEPLTSLEGTVISLTNFGAYVDVGTECDGLLHISQMTRDFFVEHPRQVLTPGDTVTVTISSVNPEMRKLHLTMLSQGHDNIGDDEDDHEERIPLDEIDIDDELWGEINRVTDYGAYVELGAQVDGFLHFMDHPEFGASPGAPPSDYMTVRDRVRVWVSDVDMDRKRIKLTANRPTHLPGPRRDIYR